MTASAFTQPLSTTAFMASNSLKTGDPLYDIPLTMILTILISVVVSMIGEFTGTFKTHIENFFLYLKRNTKEMIYGKMNYIIIESLFENTIPNLNNKIIIDAIRYSYDKGFIYQLDNKETTKKYIKEYDREMNRKIVKKIDSSFTDNGFIISYKIENVTKTVNEPVAANNTNKNNQITKDVPYKEILTICSYKSFSEIEKYILNKRNTYIDKYCSKDSVPHIFSPYSYTNAVLEFHKIPFKTHKTFDSWFYRDKEKVLSKVTNFKNKTGPYKIESCQYKLGVLLHGEPSSVHSSHSVAPSKE